MLRSGEKIVDFSMGFLQGWLMNDGHLKMISYDKICDTESITVFQDLYKPQAKLVKLAPYAAPAAVIIKSHHFSVAQNHDLA